LERLVLRVCSCLRVRRLPSNVQAERLKDGRASLSAFSNRRTIGIWKKAQNALLTNSSPLPAPTADPLPNLVQSRFRLLRECADCDDQTDDHAIERRVDEVQRRARKLDERIVRTVATSTTGLLAQVRLLAAFYEESLNGAGRRGSLLIQTITAGIERLDRLNKPRPLSDHRNARHPKIRQHRNSVLGDEEDHDQRRRGHETGAADEGE
jgi:hypothetical protein